VNNDPLTVPVKHLRATDTNSLLRLYDRMNDLQRRSPSQQEQARAAKALTRITQELRRRNVPLSTAPK
jgi:hypothetical protein